MGNPGLLTGTSWHVEKMTRASGDPKRHRARCVYFKTEDERCIKCSFKCIGSAHCKFYKEKPIESKENHPETKKITEARIVSFDGLKNIRLSDVEIDPYKFKKPSKEKIENLVSFFNTNGTLDKPIVVSCGKTKYVLEDKYLRFYVAELLGLTEIQAKIGTYATSKMEDKLRTVGTKLNHKFYGSGEIKEIKNNNFVAIFDDGKERLLSIDSCLSNGTITFGKQK